MMPLDPVTSNLVADTPSDDADIMEGFADPSSELFGGAKKAASRFESARRASSLKRGVVQQLGEEEIASYGDAMANSGADPLAMLNMLISGAVRGVSPHVMMGAYQKSVAKAQQDQINSAFKLDSHMLTRQRLALDTDRYEFDKFRKEIEIGNAAARGAYKVLHQFGGRLDDETFNRVTHELLRGDAEGVDPLSEESGMKHALAVIERVGGLRRQAPINYQYADDGTLRPTAGGPSDPAVAGAIARARQAPSQALYKTEGPSGDVTYQPRERAVGRKAPTRSAAAAKPQSPLDAAIAESMKSRAGAPAAPPAPEAAPAEGGESWASKIGRILFGGGGG